MNMWVGITVIDFISKFDGLFRIWKVWSAWRDGDPPDVLQKRSSTTARQVLNHTPASASPEVKLHSLQWRSQKQSQQNSWDQQKPVQMARYPLGIAFSWRLRQVPKSGGVTGPPGDISREGRGGRHLGVSSGLCSAVCHWLRTPGWGSSPVVLGAVQDGSFSWGDLGFTKSSRDFFFFFFAQRQIPEAYFFQSFFMIKKPKLKVTNNTM